MASFKLAPRLRIKRPLHTFLYTKKLQFLIFKYFFALKVYDSTLSKHTMTCANFWIQFSSVQLLSLVWPFVTPRIAAREASLSITNSRWLMPSNHLILCRPLHLLLSIFPSIRVSSNESVFCIRWPKYWSFRISNSPSNEYSGLIYFRMDWLDLLAVQGTLCPMPDFKASIIRCSAFFIVQLSHPYMTTGKKT